MSCRATKKLRGRSIAPKRQRRTVDPSLLLSSSAEMKHCKNKQFVRVFDDEGCLSTREVGLRWFNFALLSIFYTLRAQPWSLLITYTVLSYVGILLTFSSAYVLWAQECGAHDGITWVSALYFAVVSFAANGGYAGEQADTMLDPHHICFTGRTIIVALLSFGNIIFVGFVAALVVGKAAYGEKLVHRVVFSEFCSLTAAREGTDPDCWGLTFRVANGNASKVLAQGQLRLFIVTSESATRPEGQHRRGDGASDTADVWRRTGGDPGIGYHIHGEKGSKVQRGKGIEREAKEETDTAEVLVEEEALRWKGGSKVTPRREASLSLVTNLSRDEVESEVIWGKAAGLGQSYAPIRESDEPVERVTVKVEELQWTCSGEKHLDGRDGRLLLWFPVDITHKVNRHSPLYRYVKDSMENNVRTLSSLQVVSPPVSQKMTLQERKESPTAVFSRSFQLVVMFDATEMESGTHISARHTYAAADVVKHYRFSNQVVCASPEKSEVFVDYHYFNEMLPDVT